MAMKSTLAGFGLISLTCVALLNGMPAHAQKTVEQCANALKAKGFNVYKMDIDDGRIYDYDAIKSNQKYEIKTDMNCKVLLQQIDH